MSDDVEIKQSHGHWEVYINGEFYCSADNYTEAGDELMSLGGKYESMDACKCNF